MSPEKTSYWVLIEEMENFLNLARKKLGNSFPLKGKESDSETMYEDYVSIRYSDPKKLGRKDIQVRGRSEQIGVLNKVLALNLPRKVRDFQPLIPEQPENSTARLVSLELGDPYAVIAFGRNIGTRKEVVVMFATMDQRPKEVLREMKRIIRAAKAPLN